MAQPTFKAVGTAYQGATGPHTVQNDVSPASGDFILLVVTMSGGAGATAVATLNSGEGAAWTPLPGAPVDAGHFNVGAYRLGLFYKIAGASEPSTYGFSTVDSANTAACVFAWSGPDSSTPLSGVTPVLLTDSTTQSFLRFGTALSGLTTDDIILRVGVSHTGTTANTYSAPDANHTIRGQFTTPTQSRQTAVMEVPVVSAGVDPLTAGGPDYGLIPSLNMNSHVGVSFALAGSSGAGGPATETLEPDAVVGTPTGLTVQGGGTALAALQDPGGSYLGNTTDPTGISPNITFEGTADNAGNPTTSTTVTIPATVQNNDIITLSVVNGDGTAQPTVTDNSGVNNWTDGVNGGVIKHQAGTAMAGTVYWKRITNAAVEAGKVISITGMTGSTCANVSVRRGCVTSGSPVDGTPVSESNASGNNTQAGITTLTDGAAVALAIFYSDNTNATSGYAATSPATLTERNEITSSGGNDSGLAVAADIKATAGATGAFTWNPGTAQISVSIAYALKPASQAAQTIPTNVRVSLANPVDPLVPAGENATITVAMRKRGSGSSPTAFIRARRAGSNTDLGASSGITVSEAAFTDKTYTFDQDAILGTNGSDFEVYVESAGASGGLVEIDYIKADVRTQAAGLTAVEGTRPTAWEIRSQITNTRQAVWSIISQLTNTRATSWEIRSQIEATRAAAWSILGSVSGTRSTPWEILGNLTGTRSTEWAILGLTAVEGTRAAAWAILQHATGSRVTVWEVLGYLSATRGASWGVSEHVQGTRATPWAIIGNTSGQRTAAWAIDGIVSAQRQAAWAILEHLTNTRTTSYSIVGNVSGTRPLSWEIIAQLTGTRLTAWEILRAVEATRALSWSITGNVTGTRSTEWSLLANLLAVIGTRSTAWAIDGSVQGTRSAQWAVLQALSNSRQTAWGVGAHVTGTRSTPYEIRAHLLGSPRQTQWAILQSVVGTRATAWDVLVYLTGSREAAWAIAGQLEGTRVTIWQILAAALMEPPEVLSVLADVSAAAAAVDREQLISTAGDRGVVTVEVDRGGDVSIQVE